MTRSTQGAVLFVIGLSNVASVALGLHTRYVKESFGVALIIAGVLLIAFGLIAIFSAEKEDDEHDHDHEHHDHDHEEEVHHAHGHDHSKGPRIGWALLAPVAALALVVPPALGADAVQRQEGSGRKPTTQNSLLTPLPEGDKFELPMDEFWQHAFTDEGKSLQGKEVTLLGFATPKKDGSGWFLARLALSCCASDAFAYKVDIKGLDQPETGAWVKVTGTLDGNGPKADEYDPPILNATKMEPSQQPEPPYL